MRQKRTFQLLSVVVAILVMSVGYAAIQNVNLTVSGNVTATPDQANFKVAFTGTPTFTTTGTGTASLAITGDLAATMNVTGLKAVGETLTSKFTIANTSTDITAYLSSTVTNVNKEYFEVTSTLDATEIAPRTGTTTLNVTVKLIKAPVASAQTDTVTVDVVASPVPIETGESANTVSGVWTLNQTLSMSPGDLGYGSSYPVNFTVNGQNYTSVVFGLEMGDLFLSYNGTDAWYPGIVADYFGAEYGWQFTNANIIDFGTQPQSVDETFKTWLVANATKGISGGVQVVRPTVSGIWTLKDTVSFNESISQSVNFTSNGVNYTYMLISYETMDYILAYTNQRYHTIEEVVYYPEAVATLFSKTAGWQSNRYKVVDFGTQEQEVSQTFKTWLEANATEGNTYQTVSVSATTWKFNDTITAINLTEVVSFTANNTQYSSITISETIDNIYDYGGNSIIAYDETDVYYNYTYQGVWKGDYEEGWWEDPPAGPGGGPYLGDKLGTSPYKTITFAQGAQVSSEFYTWLTANATQQ